MNRISCVDIINDNQMMPGNHCMLSKKAHSMYLLTNSENFLPGIIECNTISHCPKDNTFTQRLELQFTIIQTCPLDRFTKRLFLNFIWSQVDLLEEYIAEQMLEKRFRSNVAQGYLFVLFPPFWRQLKIRP